MLKPKDDYIYAVARIRHRETKLFTNKHIEQMLSMPDAQSLYRFLTEHGYGKENNHGERCDLILTEQEKLWELMRELLGDLSCFDFLRIQNDYHNLKASIKTVYTETSPDGLFLSGSVYNPQEIFEAVSKKAYGTLPSELSVVAETAMSTLLRTGDGQLCDMLIDKACLERVYLLGSNSRSDVIRQYCEIFTASSDIKIAVRGAKLLKSASFMLDSMAECDTLDTETLSLSAAKGFDEVCNYLLTTDYRTAVEQIKISLSSFERWCDNKIVAIMQTQKSEPFSIGPLVAYVIAKQNEIKTVRLILTAKQNSLDEAQIRERIRDMYV